MQVHIGELVIWGVNLFMCCNLCRVGSGYSWLQILLPVINTILCLNWWKNTYIVIVLSMVIATAVQAKERSLFSASLLYKTSSWTWVAFEGSSMSESSNSSSQLVSESFWLDAENQVLTEKLCGDEQGIGGGDITWVSNTSRVVNKLSASSQAMM